MACCKCNRTGRCQNCRCVKSGRLCQGCLPQRLGSCVNTAHTPSPDVTDTDIASPSQPQNSTSTQPSMVPTSPQPPNPLIGPNTQEDTSPPLQLPGFSPTIAGTFTWGSYDAPTFINSLKAAYNEVVHWKPNLFKVPYGTTGKSFVSELSRLYKAFASTSAMECIALKATTVAPILLLQKPSAKSKAKDHSTCLERRLRTWLDGNLQDLLLEGRTIQQRIPKQNPDISEKHQKNLSRSFANKMFEGNTKAAIRLLTEDSKGGVLRLGDHIGENQTVRDVGNTLQLSPCL